MVDHPTDGSVFLRGVGGDGFVEITLQGTIVPPEE